MFTVRIMKSGTLARAGGSSRDTPKPMYADRLTAPGGGFTKRSDTVRVSCRVSSSTRVGPSATMVLLASSKPNCTSVNNWRTHTNTPPPAYAPEPVLPFREKDAGDSTVTKKVPLAARLPVTPLMTTWSKLCSPCGAAQTSTMGAVLLAAVTVPLTLRPGCVCASSALFSMTNSSTSVGLGAYTYDVATPGRKCRWS